jgi:N-acetylmuramoyl-L-alanine amidase
MLQLLIACVLTNALAAPMTVIVDPGHGGIDHGAVRDHHKEADITLNVAKKLFELLRKDRSFKPVLTRDSDRRLSLSDRARMSRDHKADIFISIHVNSSPDAKAHGAEFYFQNQLPPDEESMLLAHRENSEDGEGARLPYIFLEKNSFPGDVSAIVGDLLDGDRILRSSQLSKSLKLQWRGRRKGKTNSIRQAPFYVLSQMTVPSSLIELGFITNASDLAELNDEASRNRMAEDIYRGLKAYKESVKEQ